MKRYETDNPRRVEAALAAFREEEGRITFDTDAFCKFLIDAVANNDDVNLLQSCAKELKGMEERLLEYACIFGYPIATVRVWNDGKPEWIGITFAELLTMTRVAVDVAGEFARGFAEFNYFPGAWDDSCC